MADLQKRVQRIWNWDAAFVKVEVPVEILGAESKITMQEVRLPLESFARLLLTSVPAEWFVQPPVSSDLILCDLVKESEII